MSDTSIWSRSIPYVKDGDPVKASVTNAPAYVLSDRTEALRAMLASIQAGQQLMLRDAPLAAGISVGDVVYFSPDRLVHDKALARWQTLENDIMQLFPAPEAVYMGVVTNKAADRVGDVLSSGFATLDSAALTVLFGTTTPALGLHYLSMTSAGTVQSPAPAMIVRVLEYMGSGLVRVFPPEIEPITHTHRNYRLHQNSWVDASLFDPAIVPAGAYFGYDLAAADAVEQNLTQAILPSFGLPEFVWLYHGESSSSASMSSASPLGGLHVDELQPVLDRNGIWWMAPSFPAGDIEMLVATADTKGISILSAIRSMTPDLIKIVTSNGLVSVYFNGFVDTPNTAGNVVVKQIVGNQQLRGPVVERILAGRNVSVTPTNGQGTVAVSFDYNNNELLEATVQNLNNAITTVEAPHVLTMFPKNRLAAVSCRVMLPNLGTALYKAAVWALFISPDPNQPCPTGESTFIPAPQVAGVTPVGPTAFVFPNLPGTIVAGNVYYVESTTFFDLRSPVDFNRGVASFVLTLNNPVKDLRMVSAGLRIYL